MRWPRRTARFPKRTPDRETVTITYHPPRRPDFGPRPGSGPDRTTNGADHARAQPGPDELQARALMALAIALYGWERTPLP
ncbi:hypothetical protein [Streptomyces sp. NPDC001889]